MNNSGRMGIRPNFFMEDSLRESLADLPLGEIRYYDRIGSTNDEALGWASEGAADLSLVVANEQTHGRGRLERQWFTARDSALAFSLILRPEPVEKAQPSLLTGLLALALVDSLRPLGLSINIKWPNDVLVDGKKIAGVLVESTWTGEQPDAFVLGMGVNVTSASVPPTHKLLYPATSIVSASGRRIERQALLHDILQRVLFWRPSLHTTNFLKTWESHLAFQGEQVCVESENQAMLHGTLLGLDREGRLKLQNEHGETMTIHSGDVHLRPVP